MNTITVKVAQYPGEIKEFALEEGSTVGDALRIAGITVSAEQSITLNDESVSTNERITNGSIILVTKRLKGAY